MKSVKITLNSVLHSTNIKKLIISKITITIICFSFSIASSAQTTPITTTTKATASLSKTCSLNTTNINFGTLTPATNNMSTGTLSILCSKNASYSIAMRYSTLAPQDSPNAGLMTGAASGNKIVYGIFKSTDYGQPTWGYSALSGTGDGQTQNYTMYGVIQLNRWPSIYAPYPTPDNYSDTVATTVTF